MTSSGQPMAARLAETLYAEALALAEEMRRYFDCEGAAERDALPPQGRVQFACEALKATTRLMTSIAWLATRRAIDTGELAEGEVQGADRRLGEVSASEPAVLAGLPLPARRLIAIGTDLYERCARLSLSLTEGDAADSPARLLQQRLEQSF